MLRRLFHFWERRLASQDTNRTPLPFDLGLEWVPDWGSAGDGDNPAAHLRAELQRALENSDQFFSYSPVKEFILEGNLLRFRSPYLSADETNNVAQAQYFPAKVKRTGGGGPAAMERRPARARESLPPAEFFRACRSSHEPALS